MDAIALLEEDHRKMRQLLKEGAESGTGQEPRREELFATIRKEMEVHERIEEEIFYPALKAHPKARATVLEGFEEHHVVDEVMGELARTDVTDERWAAKFAVMTENIEHHISEEEETMFVQARRAFDSEELRELGARMTELKQLSEARTGPAGSGSERQRERERRASVSGSDAPA